MGSRLLGGTSGGQKRGKPAKLLRIERTTIEHTWRPSLLLSLPALNDLMYGRFVVGWMHVSFSAAASSRAFTQRAIFSIP